MIWITLSLIGLWFAIHWLYPMGMAAKAKYQRGELTPYWIVHLAPAIGVGLLLDIAFNYTFGWMFWAVPSPILFSATVQYHYRHSIGWRWDLSAFFARNLNVFDDHIRP